MFACHVCLKWIESYPLLIVHMGLSWQLVLILTNAGSKWQVALSCHADDCSSWGGKRFSKYDCYYWWCRTGPSPRRRWVDPSPTMGTPMHPSWQRLRGGRWRGELQTENLPGEFSRGAKRWLMSFSTRHVHFWATYMFCLADVFICMLCLAYVSTYMFCLVYILHLDVLLSLCSHLYVLPSSCLHL